MTDVDTGTDAGTRRGNGDGDVRGGVPADPDAFAALGNGIRLRTLVALLESAPQSFSELAAASGADSTAGFAYHLRQLRDRYVREADADAGDREPGEYATGDGEGYVLTDAGARIARAVRAGTYTASVDREPVSVDDACPLCGAEALVAAARDNTVAVACEDCGRAVLRLPLAPGGFYTHEDGALPTALSRQYRHRVGLMADGGCPECGGAVATRIEPAEGRLLPDDDPDGTARRDDTGDGDGGGLGRALARLRCEACGYALGVPVTLSVLDHPAVVAFYHERGVDVGDRPVWNVGSEWRERVLSTDPWAVRVSTVLDGDGLALFVAGDGRVVGTERFDADGDRTDRAVGPET